jgi:hypothetical protein
VIELPRITSSIGSSGRDSGMGCSVERLVDSEEEVVVVLLENEDDFEGACIAWSSTYDFARALNSASSSEGSFSFFSRFHHIKFNVLQSINVDCCRVQFRISFGTRQPTIAKFSEVWG